MKSITTILAVLALSAAVVTAADEKPKAAEGEKKHGDPEAMFKKLDADNDGKVSEAEFLNGPMGKKDPAHAKEVFAKKDANKDGSLSLEEMKAGGHEKKAK
ncbi:MAG: hypothetical protein QOE70_4145 [Chthoniobacter sp.]|nr:hypothetical protein [Chthoniobacter sp.]